MVQWKGNIDREEAGDKAANLDEIERFKVPNFFVLTKTEVEELLNSREPRRIANQEIPEEISEKMKEAYKEIGMSSEVRNASGQARNLVGNQRESQRVSVRISNNSNQAEHSLNVGTSGLENVIRTILASYFQENSEIPAILFQKMIEPEHTGAVIKNYTSRHTLVEMVEGLGHSLEEGKTVPEFYLIQNSSVQNVRVPEKQVEITRNPMNGQRRTRTISKNSPTFQNSEIEELAKKASREGYSIKFVYKRGSFYVVDAFKNTPLDVDPDLEALKVSEGEITGEKGRDYKIAEKLDRTETPAIARKGGYTTSRAQDKRRKKVPAVVSLKETSKLEKTDSGQGDSNTEHVQKETREVQVTATEVRSVKEFPELSGNPFSFSEEQEKFSDSLEEVLSEKKSFVDARNLREDAMVRLFELTDLEILAVEQPSEKVLEKLVDEGLEVLAVPEPQVETVKKRLERQERKYILSRLRD